ncbi:MAG: divergent PAP2 family protein [Eubacteriales bacterium]|nr:divergent PAP2 family protein [Eubacteriales bacterium]MDD3882230.1 divergent PAP2 family protein [Eubacteriales bacterium]MDD4512579.1 divergent PAP2 family protein [Eubacteriales bacterium]
MNDFLGIFSNKLLYTALFGWFGAQALKVVIYSLIERRLSLKHFFGSGGMPSSHTSMCVAVCFGIGSTVGFDSALFAVCVAFTSIVMYDAAGVRRETGKQAVMLNQIMREFVFEGKPLSQEQLKEIVGHTPLEVLGGFVCGIVIGVLMYAL